MKNASLIAMEYASLLPEEVRPEKTEGYEGFFHLTSMSGQVEHAELDYILRDHDAAILERRKDDARRAAEEINRRYGTGTVDVKILDSYRNMAEMIRPHWHLIETAYEAVREAGGTHEYSCPRRYGRIPTFLYGAALSESCNRRIQRPWTNGICLCRGNGRLCKSAA